MSYRVIPIAELMSYEFSQVEADFSHLRESDLAYSLPLNMDFDKTISQLREAHFALLTDRPSIPLLISETNNLGIKSWRVNTQAINLIEPLAQKAFLSRVNMQGSSFVSGGQSQPARETPYHPEPAKKAPIEQVAKREYEYNFDLACSEDTFRQTVGCDFSLAKTEQEGAIADWQTLRIEEITRYHLLNTIEEPKRLLASIGGSTLGISPKETVQVKKIGSSIADEAFIPLTPAVQVGSRLGLPTEGFFYHFNAGKLVQEYCILGDKRSSFFATKSDEKKLNAERGYNRDQSAILIYWKHGGKILDKQHLVYFDRQLTNDEFSKIDETWLNSQGIALDIPTMLEVLKEPTLPRQKNATEPLSEVATYHIVQIDTATGQRESWQKIADQYDLTPKALLELNPNYNEDPLALVAGDKLTVSSPQQSAKEKELGLPPKDPQVYNHPLNTIYDHSEPMLQDTSIKAINSDSVVNPELPVVMLKSIVLFQYVFSG